jgi:hypothetical protein
MIFIFNHRISNEQQIVEAQSIAEDQMFLWQGTHKQFKDLGFTENQVGGFELVNDKLEFNQDKWNTYLQSKKPLAMGKDLVKFINQTTESTLDDFQAFGIVSKLKDFLLYCQQGRCNPFTKQTFNNTLQTLDKAFENGQKELIVGLVNKWAKTVRFEE